MCMHVSHACWSTPSEYHAGGAGPGRTCRSACATGNSGEGASEGIAGIVVVPEAIVILSAILGFSGILHGAVHEAGLVALAAEIL